MHFLLHVKQQLSKGSDSTYMTAATDSQIQLNTPIQEQIPQRKQIYLLMLSILTPDQTWMDEGLEEEKKSRLTPIYLDREKVVQEAQLIWIWVFPLLRIQQLQSISSPTSVSSASISEASL